jgi:RNA polymerase sigma factor (sigma-70 family)
MHEHGFRELVAQAQQGDNHAWQRLVDGVHSQLLAKVQGLLGADWHEESFRDFLQESLVHAFTDIGRFRGGATDADTAQCLGAWMTQIVQNVVLNWVRRQEAQRHKPPGPLRSLTTAAGADESVWLEKAVAGRDPTPSQESGARERQQLIARALETLAPLEGEIVRLRIFQELSFGEIAQRLQRDESTIRYHFQKALGHLGPQLKGLV